ncbi:hypothetical protein [Streptomyces sp. ML-6]|nr:hypothetical protein [Streptomyces sp. ML-6]MDK0517615.1 hypothetical protein [Streptomyces sp. ML-6]
MKTLDRLARRLAERVLRDIDPQSVSVWDIIEPDVLSLDDTLRRLGLDPL